MEKITIPVLSPYYGPTAGFTKPFQNFIREIGDCRSKYEEDRIIRKEILLLKENLEKPTMQSKQMKENLMRVIYCEMLGHDASFGFIHAVNYTQKAKLMDKRIGYLACCLLLHEQHELTLLLMNTIQKDLKSSNIMENCIALIAVAKLVNKEMIPALLPLVSKLMEHKRDIVRKKAVMAAFWFYELESSSIESLKPHFEKTLCDRSPAVMGATLNVYLKLAEESPKSYKRFAVTFVNILKQIMEFRLSNDFTYYNVPAPWIQIKLLRILAYLGHDDQRASETMYEALKQCLSSVYVDCNIGCAVLSECLRTSVTIFPNEALTDLAAKKVGPLLVSSNNNLKYIGIDILSHLIEVDVSYAFRHQMTVIDCLSDPDDTLKRKTLVLLYRMANSSNVSVICEKMINYLRSSTDEYLRADLVNRITTLAEKFAPDNDWLIETMNTVFELGGELVRPQVAHNLMQLIGEGIGDEDIDNELRLYAVNSYLDLIDKQHLPDLLIQVICWVLGEYSYLATHWEPEDVMGKLCSLFKRRFTDESTKPWIVTAVTKIVAQKGDLPEEIRVKIEEQLNISSNMEVKQRCAELLCLLDLFDPLDAVLPVNASFENIEVDPTLSFLDEFVADALEKGAAPYKPEQQQEAEKQTPESRDEKKLNITPYPKYESRQAVAPTQDIEKAVESQPAGITSSVGGMVLPSASGSSTRSDSTKQRPSKQVWGPSGYKGGRRKKSHTDDTYSDSSSTTSSVDSESVSGGKIIKDDEASNVQTSKETDDDKPKHKPFAEVGAQNSEKAKLAKQLFAPSPRSEIIRPERAAVSAKRKVEKETKTTIQIKHEDHLPDTKQASELLLDLGTSEADENLEHDDTEKDSVQDVGNVISESTNESLLEGLVISGDVNTILSPKLENLPDLENTPEQNQSAIQQSTADNLLLDDIDMTLPTTNHQPEYTQDQKEEHLQDPQLGLPGQEHSTENLLDSLNPVIDDASSQQIAERSVPELPEELKSYISSETKVVCEDTNIKLSIQKVYTPEVLTMALYLMNQSSFSLTDVSISLQAPSNVTSELDASSETTSSVEKIDAYKLERYLLTMKLKSPSLHMVISGHISYRDSSNTQKKTLH